MRMSHTRTTSVNVGDKLTISYDVVICIIEHRN